VDRQRQNFVKNFFDPALGVRKETQNVAFHAPVIT